MDPVTAEKNTAMFRYNLLQNITVLFRLLEVIVLTALALWSSVHAAGLVRLVVPVLLGPRFVFLLANAIVLSLLLLHSHHHHGPIDDGVSAAFSASPPLDPVPQAALREDKEGAMVFEDKRVVSVGSHARRICGRSRSEPMRMRRRISPELRRSETDVGKAEEEGEEKETDYEFRRTIEEFIEKHWKLQEEESMASAMVASN